MLDATPSRRARVAVAQMTSTSDVDANLRDIERMCRLAREASCVALFLPEGFAKISSTLSQSASAESLDGGTVRACERFARENHLWLSLGGVGVARRQGVFGDVERAKRGTLGQRRQREGNVASKIISSECE